MTKKKTLDIRRKAEAAKCISLTLDAITSDFNEREEIIVIALMLSFGSCATLIIETTGEPI